MEIIKTARRLRESARQLRAIVERVTPEEFRWQESHYDHDSRHGRELLYLMANHEWVRATSEIVDITRSDAVDTTIKIDIDLDHITHEAFRKGSGRLWLPVIMLPPQIAAHAQEGSDQHRLEPDPFATVSDAAGDLLPMLPHADVHHQISAAMAEIIVNMAVARWPGRDNERPTATRDQRLLLSAAIYRLLRRGSVRTQAVERPEADTGTRQGIRAGRPTTSAVTAAGAPQILPPSSRIGNAREQLGKLLDSYNRLLDEPSGKTSRMEADSNIFPDPGSALEMPQFVPELVRRAVMVVEALVESVVVVVPINRDSAPTVLTVRVPTRNLNSGRAWKLARPSTWALRPLGHLQLDVLLSSADADRQVQIHLPDGVSFEVARTADDQRTARPSMVIEVEQPQPLKDLAVLMGQLLDRQHNWPLPLQQCLADLARAKADAVRETFRQHDVGSAADQTSDPVGSPKAATAEARVKLDELRTKLGQRLTRRSVALTELQTTWVTFQQLTRDLLRRTSANSPSPRTVVARANMIEDVSQRAIPRSAKVHVDVAVTDAEYFSIARFSGGMSLLLMTVVLGFFVAAHLLKSSLEPSPEVLAIVLTLFSAIQAGRIERPDRSTLRGLLSAAGNWLIATSILPAVILAVALAFHPSGWGPVILTGSCIGLQLLFQLVMWRGPLTANGSSRRAQRRQFCTEPLDYHYSEALRSDWWRSTTADALMIGRKAYAYVVWQATSPRLTPLLRGAQQGNPASLDEESRVFVITPEPTAQSSAAGVDNGPTNILALLRAGTVGQAATFVVFREKPSAGWADHSKIVGELDLDPDRLAPMESVTSIVDVYVGVHRDERLTITNHPLARILKAAAHRLIVLEAQLPVPVPVAGYESRQWARVRVALRDDDDIRRLAPFLDTIHKRTKVASAGHQSRVVAVQAVPTAAPRITKKLGPKPPASAGEDRLVLSSDLDVVNTGANGSESADACTWRVLAICADGRSNIESDILRGLAKARPQLRLAGLTYALLHGTAVVIMLGHQPEGHTEHEADLEAKLRGNHALAKLRVLVNEELSRRQLGSAVKCPLLRVHFRSQDQPGALLNVLDSLSKTLADELPSLRPLEPDDCSVSYARTQVAAGRAALTRLTVRVNTEPRKVSSWTSGTFEEIERKVRTLAGLEAAAERRASFLDDELDTPENPVISISLIRAPGQRLGPIA